MRPAGNVYAPVAVTSSGVVVEGMSAATAHPATITGTGVIPGSTAQSIGVEEPASGLYALFSEYGLFAVDLYSVAIGIVALIEQVAVGQNLTAALPLGQRSWLICTWVGFGMAMLVFLTEMRQHSLARASSLVISGAFAVTAGIGTTIYQRSGSGYAYYYPADCYGPVNGTTVIGVVGTAAYFPTNRAEFAGGLMAIVVAGMVGLWDVMLRVDWAKSRANTFVLARFIKMDGRSDAVAERPPAVAWGVQMPEMQTRKYASWFLFFAALNATSLGLGIVAAVHLAYALQDNTTRLPLSEESWLIATGVVGGLFLLSLGGELRGNTVVRATILMNLAMYIAAITCEAVVHGLHQTNITDAQGELPPFTLPGGAIGCIYYPAGRFKFAFSVASLAAGGAVSAMYLIVRHWAIDKGFLNFVFNYAEAPTEMATQGRVVIGHRHL